MANHEFKSRFRTAGKDGDQGEAAIVDRAIFTEARNSMLEMRRRGSACRLNWGTWDFRSEKNMRRVVCFLLALMTVYGLDFRIGAYASGPDLEAEGAAESRTEKEEWPPTVWRQCDDPIRFIHNPTGEELDEVNWTDDIDPADVTSWSCYGRWPDLEAFKPDQPHREIVYSIGSAHVLWIPQSLLLGETIDRLPVPKKGKEKMRWLVQVAKYPLVGKFGRDGWPKCIPPVSSRGPVGTSPYAKSLPQQMSSSTASFVGTVVDIEPGWNNHQYRVDTGYFVVIDDLLQDKTGLLEEGEVVLQTVRGGRLSVAGTEICTEGYRRVHEPEIGDRVLVNGQAYSGRPHQFQDFGIFIIRDEVVLPEIYSHQIHERTWNVEDLISEVDRLVVR